MKNTDSPSPRLDPKYRFLERRKTLAARPDVEQLAKNIRLSNGFDQISALVIAIQRQCIISFSALLSHLFASGSILFMSFRRHLYYLLLP